ncbi:MAG: histidine phosphatase family protein [Gemmatimonadetes bacterium]|nr:histidine phosphatase family protein [Gemmatimonadota bacterium]
MDLFLIRHGESTNNALIDNHITFEDAMDLFLIRHGESANNALTDISQRVADPELTELGRAQAEQVAAYLAEGLHLAPAERAEDRPFFDQLYCSPMIRTLHTAQAIEQAMESKSDIWVAIHEMGGIYLDHGGERGTVGYPGLTRAEIAARFPTSVAPAEVGEDGWWDAGMETEQQAQRRAMNVAANLLARAGEETRVGLVTHGGFMSLLLSALGNQAMDDGSYYAHDNTGITRIALAPGGTTVVKYLNRTEHLSDEL